MFYHSEPNDAHETPMKAEELRTLINLLERYGTTYDRDVRELKSEVFIAYKIAISKKADDVRQKIKVFKEDNAIRGPVDFRVTGWKAKNM